MDAKSIFLNFKDREKCYTSNCKYFAINPNPFPNKSMVKDIILELIGVHDLHPRSQERPPRVPDGCQINFFQL